MALLLRGDGMTNWVRLWEDMPCDPKWRVIAKRSGRPVAEVLAVFVHMMTNAGQRTQPNASERGVLINWSDEDVAAALDIEPENVAAIRDAMQGKTLEGEKLKGWEKRQPKREDGAAERAKAWRERNRTQPNATERPDKIREDKIGGGDTRARLRQIEQELRKANDCENSPAPLLADLSPILGLIDAGFDLETEILPSIRARPNPGARTWGYFVAQIKRSRADRLAAQNAPISEARAGPMARPRHGGKSTKQVISEMLAESENEQDSGNQGNRNNLVRLPIG